MRKIGKILCHGSRDVENECCISDVDSANVDAEADAKREQRKERKYGSAILRADMAPFDLDACIQQLLRKQLLHEALLREICEKTKEVLMRESNVVHVSAPVTVVGDIHG